MSTDHQPHITVDKFNLLIRCQYIRFDKHGKCHWVMYQRSKTLDRDERSQIMAMYTCIRCDAPTYVTENMPYCAACLERTIAEEKEWDREERLERAAEEKAAAELVKKEGGKEKTRAPRTWKEVSETEKAAREAKKAKKKEVRKTLTLKDMLIQEDKKKTKSLKTMFSQQ